MDELRIALRRELVSHFKLKPHVTDDAELFSSGLIDSLSVMDLVAFIEQQLDCSVSPSDITLENFDSIDRIVGFAGKLMSSEGS